MYVCVFRKEGHNDLAERLTECQFELTDRLASFLCNKKPGDLYRILASHLSLLNNLPVVILQPEPKCIKNKQFVYQQ